MEQSRARLGEIVNIAYKLSEEFIEVINRPDATNYEYFVNNKIYY